jgi:molybdopterin converting factor subunit 1
MKIRVRYFASLREIVGQSEEILTVPEEATVIDAQALLITRYPQLQTILERCLSALNRGYVAAETALHEEDELVFIPPMGGGRFQEMFCATTNPTYTRAT